MESNTEMKKELRKILFISLEYIIFGLGCLLYGIVAAILKLKFYISNQTMMYCMVPYILFYMFIFNKFVKKIRKKFNYEL